MAIQFLDKNDGNGPKILFVDNKIAMSEDCCCDEGLDFELTNFCGCKCCDSSLYEQFVNATITLDFPDELQLGYINEECTGIQTKYLFFNLSPYSGNYTLPGSVGTCSLKSSPYNWHTLYRQLVYCDDDITDLFGTVELTAKIVFGSKSGCIPTFQITHSNYSTSLIWGDNGETPAIEPPVYVANPVSEVFELTSSPQLSGDMYFIDFSTYEPISIVGTFEITLQ